MDLRQPARCEPRRIAPARRPRTLGPAAADVLPDGMGVLAWPGGEMHAVTDAWRISRKESPREKALDKGDGDFEHLFLVVGTQLGLDLVHDHPKREPVSLCVADELVENCHCL